MVFIRGSAVATRSRICAASAFARSFNCPWASARNTTSCRNLSGPDLVPITHEVEGARHDPALLLRQGRRIVVAALSAPGRLSAGLALGRAIVLPERLNLQEEDVARDGLGAAARYRCPWRARSTTPRRPADRPSSSRKNVWPARQRRQRPGAASATADRLLLAAVHGVDDVQAPDAEVVVSAASTNTSSMLVARRSRAGFENDTTGGFVVEHINRVLRRRGHERARRRGEFEAIQAVCGRR